MDVLFVISSIGYNITRPIALRYGCHDYDSLQISHSEVQSSIQKIKAVHNLLVKPRSNKVINLLFQWYQHASGTTYQRLEDPPHRFSCVDSRWMNKFAFLLKKYKIELKLPNSYIPKHQPCKDWCLRNNIRGIIGSKIQLQQINAYHLCLTVNF